jgi:carboxypeptidase Q
MQVGTCRPGMTLRSCLMSLVVGTIATAGTYAHDDTPASAPTGRPGALVASDTPGPLERAFSDVAARILRAAEAGTNAWSRLEVLCDEIGPRLSGSAALEKAIAWAQEEMKRDGLENVRAEPVMVRRWVRGNESLTLLAPREAKLAMLGLGGSIGTPPEGIEGEVLVVDSFEALEQLGENAAAGKIVLFNVPMPQYSEQTGSGYGRTVRYRTNGPDAAAKAGAVACLVRSVTATAMYSPHTGATGRGQPSKIPAAAITVEDAEMMARLSRRNVPIRVRLFMEARDEGQAPSANVVAELVGREKPDEIVIVSGHYDSWDVGCGAHDDGGPCMAAWEAVSLLKRLDLRPRRTIRVVLWTNEENGLAGGTEYRKTHAADLAKHVAAIETDSGVFAPQGFSIQMSDREKQDRAAAQLADIVGLLRPIGATRVTPGYSGADIGDLSKSGVACLGLDVDASRYFDYHHAPVDTLDKIDRQTLDRNVAALAVMAYALAEMPGRLGD